MKPDSEKQVFKLTSTELEILRWRAEFSDAEWPLGDPQGLLGIVEAARKRLAAVDTTEVPAGATRSAALAWQKHGLAVVRSMTKDLLPHLPSPVGEFQQMLGGSEES